MAVGWSDSNTSNPVAVKDAVPNLNVKMIWINAGTLVSTGPVGGTDTISVNLKAYGCSNIHGVIGFQETTIGSVTQQMAVSSTTGGVVGFTTAVSSGVLTITPLVPAVTAIHGFLIIAY